MDIINVMDYDPSWAQQFQHLKVIYNNALGDNFLSIEHVGSTSVPGLAAKPILDIDIVVKDEAQLNKVISVIVLLGYHFMGDQGIKERYAFKPVNDFSPYDGSGISQPKHHLYCCIEGSVSLNNHLLFRNALRKSRELATEYGEFKKGLALITSDIDVYVESKSSFITNVLKKKGFSADIIQEIIAQNKKK